MEYKKVYGDTVYGKNFEEDVALISDFLVGKKIIRIEFVEDKESRVICEPLIIVLEDESYIEIADPECYGGWQAVIQIFKKIT